VLTTDKDPDTTWTPVRILTKPDTPPSAMAFAHQGTNAVGGMASLSLDSSTHVISVADIDSKPLDIYRTHLAQLLAEALHCDPKLASEAISFPREGCIGDLEVTLARLKLKGIDLKKLAADVTMKARSPRWQHGGSVDVLTRLILPYQLPEPSSLLFSNPPFADGAHLRFFYNPAQLPRVVIPHIRSQRATYGRVQNAGLSDSTCPSSGSRRVLVEYSSPAIGKDFDGNHLRSTVLGSFVANAYEHMGWNVVRMNYLGDWGKQIGLLAAALRRYGSEESLESDPLRHIHQVCDMIREPLRHEREAQRLAREEGQAVETGQDDSILAEQDAFFTRMEGGDPAAMALCSRIRNYTLGCLKPAYQRFGFRFDEYCGESQVKAEVISKIETEFRQSGMYEEEDGAWIVDFEKHGGKGKGLGSEKLRDHSGSSTYLLRHVATALERDRSMPFDKMIYVVSSRQNVYFRQVKMVLDLLGRRDLVEKLEHVSFGEVHGISNSLGNAYSLGGILDAYSGLVRDIATADATNCNIARILATAGYGAAVSSLVASMALAKRAQGVAIEPHNVVLDDGESPMRLHTCLVRLSRTVVELRTDEVAAVSPDYSCLESDSTADLLGMMARFPDVVVGAYEGLEPCAVLTYLLGLADAISEEVAEMDDQEEADEYAGKGNTEGNEEDEEEGEGEKLEHRRARLDLYECAEQTLKNGMMLLGIPILNAPDTLNTETEAG
jgi:arginyl-tRNA synthetase